MKNILIIEDEKAIAELERDYLESYGFSVHIEGRGDIGLQKALEGKFDLIILDVMLPSQHSCSNGDSQEGRYR
jgi:DNA-binding response OmpR family regulator